MVELPGWIIPALLVVALLIAMSALVYFAVSDWQRYQKRGTRRGYRRRRSAHERFALARASAREQSEPLPSREPVAAPALPLHRPPPADSDDEDALLRDLLNQ